MKSLLTAYIDISVWKLFSYTIFCVGMLLLQVYHLFSIYDLI